MTWEIVLGIIALTGFVGTFIGATVKMTSTFYTLDITLKDLKETLNEFKLEDRSAHKTFSNKLENHESRITRLESELARIDSLIDMENIRLYGSNNEPSKKVF